MSMEITILGCGNAAGTPSIGNYWGNCDPNEPKNVRSRPSIAVQSKKTTIAVDTGPDFKAQINRENIEDVHAVLYTHAHADHLHGIDDLRVLRNRHKRVIPAYGMDVTLDEIEERFSYLFKVGGGGIYPKVVEPRRFSESDYCTEQTFEDITFVPFKQDHGTCISLGYRFGSAAYSTDMLNLDDDSFAALAGIKTWVVDAAGYTFHQNPVHATLKKVYELNERVQAKQVYLTHLTQLMDYQTLLNELPEGFAPAYDGLRIDCA